MGSTMMLSGGLIGVTAAGVWLCSRSAWLTVDTVDDKPGPVTTDLVGAVWAPELTSITLVMVAALFATTTLGLVGCRIVGGLATLLAIAVSWTPVTLLARGEEGVDSQRALDLLTSRSATQRANDTVTVADWAQISVIEVHAMGPALTLLYCALALVGAVLLVCRPGTVKKQRSSAYETPEVRRQRIAEDPEEDPQPGRALWDALDVGVDPTDLDKK